MKKKIYPFYFVLGALIIYFVFLVVPGIIGMAYSFTDWSSYSSSLNFVGLANFKEIFFGQDHYLSYMSNTITFTVISTILKLILSLALALLLNEGIKGKNFHRAIIFMPSILSMLITGLIFKSILDPMYGLLNQTLKSIGLGFLGRQWLVDPRFAFGSIISVDSWKGVGYVMTILLAGLQSISPEYYEAADIDGASSVKKLKFITLPLLRPAITVTVVLGIFYGLKVFDIVYVMTNGGPGYATTVLNTSIYQLFGSGNWGLGSALNTLLFVFMIVVGFFTVKLLDQNAGENNEN